MTRFGASIAACLLASPLAALAQDSSITGVVTDQTGGVLPGVTVAAAGQALAGPRVTVTDGEGRYAVDALPAGGYSVTFSLSGFETAVRDGVRVTDAESAVLDAVLTFARLSEEVTIVGSKLDTGR